MVLSWMFNDFDTYANLVHTTSGGSVFGQGRPTRSKLLHSNRRLSQLISSQVLGNTLLIMIQTRNLTQ